MLLSGLELEPNYVHSRRKENFNILYMYMTFKMYFLICFYSNLSFLFSGFIDRLSFSVSPGKQKCLGDLSPQILLVLFCWILKSCISNIRLVLIF